MVNGRTLRSSKIPGSRDTTPKVETSALLLTGWERTVHVSRCPALYSGRIFVPLCRELIIFVF